jgi:hypothetical protein
MRGARCVCRNRYRERPGDCRSDERVAHGSLLTRYGVVPERATSACSAPKWFS